VHLLFYPWITEVSCPFRHHQPGSQMMDLR
jgi:hypothetical protein